MGTELTRSNFGVVYSVNNPAAIELSHVHVVRDGRSLLEDVNLKLAPGEFTAVIGPNGGGKSTLLRVMLGLMGIEQGEVKMLGKSPSKVRTRVGYVPQQIVHQPGFPIRVSEVVAMGLSVAASRGFSQRLRSRDKIQLALEEVGVANLADQPFHALSGGQRQRVYIARALIGEPEILLFDEPTANIDPDGTYCFHELLERLHKRMTMVMVSHDFSVTAPMVDSVACVNSRLIYNADSQLTPEMLALIYGVHTDACPMGCYLSDLSNLVIEHQHHVDH